MSRVASALMLLVLAFAAVSVVFAQAPTGIISGTVTDSSGAVVPNATVTITNKATGIARVINANTDGLYSAPSLPPGDYEVKVEMQGFRTTIRAAQVLAGSPTTVDMALQLGATREVVTVEAASAQVNYENNTISGVVERATIQDLPLNGRSSLQLAQLEPGVTVAPGSPSQFNALFNVTILGGTGAYGIGPLITMDGGVINDEMEGGTSMNFSQEVVQEFQLSSLNYDVGTGITSSGAINIVTRSGGNDFHGAGYFFFRDHNMAAYPGLARVSIDPNPFFARRNPGANIGGPVKRDKLFFFFSYEHMNQTSVFADEESSLPSTAALNGVYPSPLHYNWINLRLDYRINDKNTLFIRYSHDGNNAFAPYLTAGANPSNWNFNINWSDQNIMGLTTTITPNLVSDFRFQFHYWENNVVNSTGANCVFPCIGGPVPGQGAGASGDIPAILSLIGSPNAFIAGEGINSPQFRQARSFQPREDLSWQKGAHRIRFGVNYEYMKTKTVPWDFCDPGCMELFSPEFVQSLNLGPLQQALFPTLPTKITSTQDLLNLPVYNGAANIYQGFGIGNGTFPGFYQHNEGGRNQRIGAYVADTWKVRDNLTVNFGLGWEAETGLFYSNIPLPQFLSPIFTGQTGGAPYGLGATQPNTTDFSPSVGFAWSLGKSKKTVIRGGGGMYWDTQPIWEHFREGAAIGPVGDGRTTLGASAFTNTIPGIFNLSAGGAPVPVGAPLPVNALTNMTLGQFLQIYNQQFPALEAALAPIPQSSGPFSVAGIDVAKQGIEIYPSHFPLTRSYQTSIGVQRELSSDMVLTVDWARRQFENTQVGEVDLNFYGRTIPGTSTPNPVIPACAPGQAAIVSAECSTGPVTVWDPEGRSVYNGLLVKLNKRLTHHYSFLASYALQKLLTVNTDSNLVPWNTTNFFQSYGPGLATHQLNVAGVVQLPWGFSISLNNFIQSSTPQEPFLANIDMSNTGQTNTALSMLDPHIGFDQSLNASQITAAVNYINANYAGTKDPHGNVIPTLSVPTSFTLSRPIFSQDFSVKKQFVYKERYRLQIQYDIFNAFNISNLTGYGLALNEPGFGVATDRLGADSPFGSGGTRAMQVGARLSF
jgi:carboxypeptidase family protein